MASYEVGEDGEDSAAIAQSRNLLYADYFTVNFIRYGRHSVLRLLLSFVVR